MKGSTTTHEFDLAIIGGGSAGYAAARTAAAEGLKTVVIEGGEEVGGLCILRGCMPTKALLYAAEVMHLATHARPWGVHAPKVSFDFGEVMHRKNVLIQEFADFRRQQLSSGNFEFIRARARFTDAHTLELARSAGHRLQADGVQRPTASGSNLPPAGKQRKKGWGGEVQKLTSKNFIIATGSTIAPSPLPQLNEINCLNSDTALNLKRLPKSLIVLGGGAVAVEFAQFFARFGVKVTLIQRSEHVLHEFDADAAGEIEKVFRREGIEIYTGTRLVDARRVGRRKQVTFERGRQVVRVQAEEVFFALGRIPHVESLGLEEARVRLEYTRIVSDEYMQTSLPHVYAAGDCTGLHEIVHIAIQQAEIAAHNIAHPDRRRRMDYRLLTEVIFTDPQIATVGLTEKRAHVRNIPFRTASYRFSDHGKSLIMEARDGFVKLLADPMTGEIIGGCCVGPSGGELIHEIIVAMHSRMTVHELAALPHYHPTLAEIWTYPAEELAARIKK